MHLNSKLSEIDRKIKSVDADIKKAEERLAKHKRGFLLRISLCVVAVIVALTMFGIYKKINPTIDGVTYRVTDKEGNDRFFDGDEYEVDKIKRGVTEVDILTEVNGKPVTRFCAKIPKSLVNITLPDVFDEMIDDYLFYNAKNIKYNEYDNGLYIGSAENPYLWLVKAKSDDVTSCVAHNDTKYIFRKAFYGLNHLENVVLGGNVEVIGQYAFANSGIKRIEACTGLKVIEGYAFYESSLSYIEIPNTVEIIGDWAFKECGLRNIKVPLSVKIMGSDVFGDTFAAKAYCEATSRPVGWEEDWGKAAEWGHKCEADEWKTDKDGNSVLRCKDCKTILDEKHGN